MQQRDTVRRKVEWIERDTVLPPELFSRFLEDAFWRHPEANIRGATLITYDG
jgi:sulfotransferase